MSCAPQAGNGGSSWGAQVRSAFHDLAGGTRQILAVNALFGTGAAREAQQGGAAAVWLMYQSDVHSQTLPIMS